MLTSLRRKFFTAPSELFIKSIGQSSASCLRELTSLDDDQFARLLIPSKAQQGTAFAKERWQATETLAVDNLINGSRWMINNINEPFSLDWLETLYEKIMIMSIFFDTFTAVNIENSRLQHLSLNKKNLINKAYTQYKKEISDANTKTNVAQEKITAIAKFTHVLATIKPFKYGNLRVIQQVLNKLLLNNELPITILRQPSLLNESVDVLVDEIISGMKDFNHFVKTGFLPLADISKLLEENPFQQYLNDTAYKNLPIDVKKVLHFERESSETLFQHKVFSARFLPLLSTSMLYGILYNDDNKSKFFSDAFLTANEKIRHQFILSSYTHCVPRFAQFNFLQLRQLLLNANIASDDLIYETTPLQKMAVIASVHDNAHTKDGLILKYKMFARGDFSTTQMLNSAPRRRLRKFKDITRFSDEQLYDFDIEQYIYIGSHPILGHKKNMSHFGLILEKNNNMWEEYALLPLCQKEYLCENSVFINALLEKTNVSLREIFSLKFVRLNKLKKVFNNSNFFELKIDWSLIKKCDDVTFHDVIAGYLGSQTYIKSRDYGIVASYIHRDSILNSTGQYTYQTPIERFIPGNEELTDSDNEEENIDEQYDKAKKHLSDKCNAFDNLNDPTKKLITENISLVDHLKRKWSVSNSRLADLGNEKLRILLNSDSNHKLFTEELDYQVVISCKPSELAKWLTQSDYVIPAFNQHAAEERQYSFKPHT